MLREWIKNIPLAHIETIVADQRVKGQAIWLLAVAENDRRRQAVAA